MCGVSVVGENKFRVAPMPGGSFSFARMKYRSVYGEIESGWEKTKHGWKYNVFVPANTAAEIVLPDGTRRTVGAGKYTF